MHGCKQALQGNPVLTLAASGMVLAWAEGGVLLRGWGSEMSNRLAGFTPVGGKCGGEISK